MNPRVPPPVVVVIVGALMWALDKYLAFARFEFAFQTVVAGILLMTGLLLMLVAAVSFVAVKTTINPLRPSRASSLVTSGVFGLSRNPIYLGDLLVLAAFAVWLGNGASAALLGPFVWYINRFQIIPEERALTEIFGESYVTYCERVRRWL